MPQVNEYVQKLIAARDSDLFADVDPLNQLLKPKGENGSDFWPAIYLSCQTARKRACLRCSKCDEPLPIGLDGTWCDHFNSPIALERERACDTQPIQSRKCKSFFSATATT